MPLKAQFGQKLARDVMYYHNRIIQRFEKNGYSRQYCRLPDSSIRGVVFWIRISPRIRSQNQNSSKCSVRDLGQSDLYRQTDRQTDRQADRRTDRQTERQTERQTSKYLPVLFGTWLGMIRITWGKSPEWLCRNPRFPKGHYRCTANLCYQVKLRYEASQVWLNATFSPQGQQSLV